jgi:prepilin peptidase CpaA
VAEGFEIMSNQILTTPMWIALAVGTAAIVEDVWRRQISNWIPVSALAAGFGWQIWANGWRGAGDAGLGMVTGFLVFLIFYILGGMGGGDVKLMAGFGALLGPWRSVEAALYTAVIGALLAVLVLAASSLMRWWRKAEKGTAPASIPYAPAIALGVWLALVPH